MSDPNQYFSIKSWHEDDRPREKLMAKGKTSLTDAELISILIASGSKKESALALSQRILASVHHNLNSLGKQGFKQLTTFKGIGPAKAISIIAALELGRRRQSEDLVKTDKISSSQSVFQLMQPALGELAHEEFWVIYLNNSNNVLNKTQLSKGGITGTLVDVRLVFKEAIAVSAVAIILVHNHPSGSLKPSEADKNLTQKLKKAGESLDIKVLDHLIVTEQAYYSFADEGIL